MMALNITRGPRRKAARVVLYGVEGVGKTTLAAQFPNALILDVEAGSDRLDVARQDCTTYADAVGHLHDLTRDAMGFETLVVDSIDRLESMAAEHVCKIHNKRSLEDFAYGKGYVLHAEEMARFLGQCDTLHGRGMNVVLVGHSTVKRTSPPDETDGFDRYELRLERRVAPLVKEWADALLFLTFKMRLVAGTDGRMKAKGGRERVIHTERAAAFDAKNRFGLPPEIDADIAALAPLFATAAPRLKSAPPTDVAKLLTDTSRRIASATAAQLRTLRPKILARATAGELTNDQAGMLVDQLDARLASMEPVAQEAGNGLVH